MPIGRMLAHLAKTNRQCVTGSPAMQYVGAVHPSFVAAIKMLKCWAPDRQNQTLQDMPTFTIGRMAKLYRLHRSSLYQAVNEGRVTAGHNGKGQLVIDLSEMIRVYGEPLERTRQNQTPESDTSIAIPTAGLQSLLEELRLLREEVHELRKNLLLLEHKPAPRLAKDKEADPLPHRSATKSVSFADLLISLDDD